MDKGAWWATVRGVAKRVGHNCSDLEHAHMWLLSAEMTGLLGWHQGLKVTVLSLILWEKTYKFSLQKLLGLQTEGSPMDSCRVVVATGPMPLLMAGNGSPTGLILCCPSQHPTVLQAPDNDEVTYFPGDHGSAPQTPQWGFRGVPSALAVCRRCFRLRVRLSLYILHQRCPSFRFLDQLFDDGTQQLNSGR